MADKKERGKSEGGEGGDNDFSGVTDFLNEFNGIPDDSIGRSYREVILRVTGGDPEKLAKLKEQMRLMLDDQEFNPSDFDPEKDDPDEII